MRINRWFINFSAFALVTCLLILAAGCSSMEDKNKPQSPTQQASLVPISPSIDKAIDDPNLSTFKNALFSGGLQDIFIGTGPFTVFAPTNDAFDKLGKEKLQELLKQENKDQLVTILIYHFVPGKYLANMLKSRSYKTINGKTVDIVVDDEGKITVNKAKVVKTDMVGPNGVIHEIDTVLIP